jgi:hypothetical protein
LIAFIGQLSLITHQHDFLTYRLVTIIRNLLSINRNDFFNNPLSHNQVKKELITEVVKFYSFSAFTCLLIQQLDWIS